MTKSQYVARRKNMRKKVCTTRIVRLTRSEIREMIKILKFRIGAISPDDLLIENAVLAKLRHADITHNINMTY